MQAKSGQPPRKKPGRASLPPLIAPPRNAPFTGLTGLPARNTQIPNLTEHVAIAKAKVTALKDAGLVPEAKREAAHQAQQIIQAGKPLAHPFVGGKPAPAPAALPARLSKPAVALDQPTAQKRAPAIQPVPSSPGRGAPSNPRAGMAAYTEAHKGSGIDLGFAGDAVRNQVRGVLRDPLSAVLPPGLSPALHAAGINVTSEVGHAGVKTAEKIRSAGSKSGAIPTSFLTPAQAATFPGQKTVTEEQVRELEAQKGGLGGLPQAARNTLIAGAVSNGWPRWMAAKAVDSDLIHLYGNKPANPIIQFAKNIGSFAATQAAAPAGMVAIGDAAVQAAKGNTDPLAKQVQQFVEGSTVGIPGIGPHPTLQSWYWQPGESAQNISLVAGLADRAASKAAKFAPGVERSITPEGFAAPVSRGTLSTRPLQRGVEKARDAYVRSEPALLNDLPGVGPKARRTAIAKDAYAATRERAVAPVLAESNQLRSGVMQAASKISKERAAALNAYLKGSDPAERAAFYDQVSSELGAVKGRGAAAHAKLSTKHPVTEETLTPKDRAYVDAVRAAATFSTKTRAGAGQLSADLSGRYRAYHEPIVIAAKNGDELASRTQFLHDEWTDALAKKVAPEKLAEIADQFDNALDDFTARHAEQGRGTTPVYIPEVIPQTLTSKFSREASITATPKVAKLKATKDTLVSTGRFRSLPADVSLETHRAAVVRARIDHFQAVESEYATKAPNGEPADPNVVYVKAENLRAPVKLENTVGEHNLTDDAVHSTLDQMRMALEGGRVDVTGGYIPQHGDIRAIPKSIYEELHASTTLPKGAPVGLVYDKLNRGYQRFMLSKPSTAVSNIVGNPILAGIGGASPLDIAKGYGLAKNHPEWIPPRLLGEGLAGSAGPRIARTPIGKYINYSLSHQRASEDAARAALYHHKVGPYVRQQMKETGRSADEILKDLANGKDVNGAKFAKQVEDFLGNMRPSKKISPDAERMISRGILFHRWLGHILTLSLYTLPVKYPGRAVLLQRISEIGDDYRKHHGVFPSWYVSMIPLMQHIATDAGVPESFTRVLPTGTIWPTANLPIPLADSQGANPWSAVIGSTQPVVRAAIEAPTGMSFENLRPYKDAQGNDINPGLNADLFLGQQYRNVPYAGVVTPFAGQGDTSYPGNFNMRVNKNKYGKPLPDGFGTNSRPYGGNQPSLTPEYALGLLSRLALGGSGLQDLPAQTRGTNYSRTKQLVTARQGHNKIIRDRAKAKAKKG